MNRAEAYKAAAEGKKVRHKDWMPVESHITLNDTRVMYYNSGSSGSSEYQVMYLDMPDEGYEILEEKKEVGLPEKLDVDEYHIGKYAKADRKAINQLIDYLQQREENESK